MAITVKHKFVSAIPDAGDSTIVQPSNWNDTHQLVGVGTMAEQNANSVAITGGAISGVTLPASNITGVLPVANGGTGVTVSNGANSVVLRDANGNITTNAVFEGFINQTASATPIVLLTSSVANYTISGSGGQVIQLPNATTLPLGANFYFNNNQSSGAITVNNNSTSLIVSIPSGAFTIVSLLANGTAAGTWDWHDQAPANTSWSTNTLSYPGSITNATWNGVVIATNRGGTGLSTVGTAGQVLTSNGTTLSYTTPTTGTVTSVTGTGTVSGISLSGTVTASGNLTLGGTLDLSSPPIIGGTTPAAITGTTITATKYVGMGGGVF